MPIMKRYLLCFQARRISSGNWFSTRWIRTAFWRSQENSHPAMMSILPGEPAVCCNWCAAHKPRRARNPGKNGLWNFRRLVQRKNALAANSALADEAKFRQRNLVAKNELVYRDMKRVLSRATKFFGQ